MKCITVRVLLAVAIFAGLVAAEQAGLFCYTVKGLDSVAQSNFTMPMKVYLSRAAPGDVCYKASTPCPDTNCSGGSLIWIYSALSEKMCNELRQQQITRGSSPITCCTTSGCNKPDPQADPKTIVVENSYSAAPSTGGTAESPGSCYVKASVSSTSTFLIPVGNDPNTMCYRAQVPNGNCLTPTCANVPLVWEYAPTDVDSCNVMAQNQPPDGPYRNVLCCRQAGCNAPDRALDPVTTIVSNPYMTPPNTDHSTVVVSNGTGSGIISPVLNNTASTSKSNSTGASSNGTGSGITSPVLDNTASTSNSTSISPSATGSASSVSGVLPMNILLLILSVMSLVVFQAHML